MVAHRIEATLSNDRSLTLHDLPFQAGEAVEVIVLPRSASATSSDRYPLRGRILRYDDPFEPVAADDWDANQ